MTDVRLETRLALCLAARLGATDVEVRDLRVPQEGRSGAMVSFSAAWQADGSRHERKLIARFPASFELFLEYDLMLEWQAMEALAARNAMPTKYAQNRRAGIHTGMRVAMNPA